MKGAWKSLAWPVRVPRAPKQSKFPESARHAADGLGDRGHRLIRHIMFPQPSGEPTESLLLVEGAVKNHLKDDSTIWLPHGPHSPSSLTQAGWAMGQNEEDTVLSETRDNMRTGKRKGGKRHRDGYRPHKEHLTCTLTYPLIPAYLKNYHFTCLSHHFFTSMKRDGPRQCAVLLRSWWFPITSSFFNDRR